MDTLIKTKVLINSNVAADLRPYPP